MRLQQQLIKRVSMDLNVPRGVQYDNDSSWNVTLRTIPFIA